MRTETFDGKTYHFPVEADDVTKDMLALSEEVFDDWFSDDEQIDWEDFIDRLASYSRNVDPPWEFDEYHNPAVNKIKRHIREYRNQ